MAQAVLGNYTKNSTNGSATSLTLSKPTGVVNGDLLLLLVGNENTASGQGFSAISGWTLEFNYGSSDVATYIGLYSRIATGDTLEDAPVVPFLANDDGYGWYINVKDADRQNPISVIGSSQEVVSDTITLTSLTSVEDSLAISTISFDGSDGDPFTESGTGWSLEDWAESPDPSDASGASSGAWSTKVMVDGGATDTSIFNTNDGALDGIVGTMFIIKGDQVTYGSIDIDNNTSFSIEGEAVRYPDYGVISINNTSSLVVSGDARYDKEGSANLAAIESFTTTQGLIFVLTSQNLMSIINDTSFSIEGEAVRYPDYGSINITSDADITINGSLYQHAIIQTNSIDLTLSANDVIVTGEGSVAINIDENMMISSVNDVTIDVVFHLSIDVTSAISTLVVNTPEIMTETIISDVGITLTSIANGVSVGLGAGVLDTSITLNIIPNEVVVLAATNIIIDDGGILATFVANDVSVYGELSAIAQPTALTLEAIANDVEITYFVSEQTFPSYVCIIQEGFSQELTRGMRCLSGSYKAGSPIVNGTLIFDTNKEMNDFYYWWVNETNHGANTFTIDLRVMGVRRDWEVKVTESFTTTLLDKYIRKVPLKFEIQDDAVQYLPATSYGFVYPDEVGCIILDGYQETSGNITRCLGGGGRSVNETMTGKILVEDNHALMNLSSWYINELEYGKNSFTVKLPFMGTMAMWEVKFVDNLTNSLLSGTMGTVAIKLELLNYEPNEFMDNLLFDMDAFILIDGTQYIENAGYTNPYDNSEMFGSNWIDLATTGANISLPTQVGGYVTYLEYSSNMFITEMTLGDTTPILMTIQSYFTTDVQVTDEDILLLNANPVLLYNLWFGSSLTGLSFTADNIKNLISCTEGLDGGAILNDLVTGLIHTISSYVPQVRTNMMNTNKGVSNFQLVTEGAGIPLSVQTDFLVGEDDGRFIRLPLTAPQDFYPLKDVASISGTKTKLVVHYDDGTEFFVSL